MLYSQLTDKEKKFLDVLKKNVEKTILPYDQSYAKNWEYYEMIHTDYLDDFASVVNDEKDVISFVGLYHLDRNFKWESESMWEEYYEIFPSDIDDDETIRRNQENFIVHWSDEDIDLPEEYDYAEYEKIVEAVRDAVAERIVKENWEHFKQTALKLK